MPAEIEFEDEWAPDDAPVRSWLEEGLLTQVAEDYSPGDGYGYLHLLTRAG